MTKEERIEMYLKCPKEVLAQMLADRDEIDEKIKLRQTVIPNWPYWKQYPDHWGLDTLRWNYNTDKVYCTEGTELNNLKDTL